MKVKSAKNNSTLLYRQGDILIRRVAQVPANAKAQAKTKSLTIALGEVTGHAHVLEVQGSPRETAIVPYRDATDTLFFSLMSEAFLKHDEHAPIALPAGTYEVVRQREYTPQAIRNVAD